MNIETKYKVKAFAWDQLIRPFYALINLNVIKLLLLVVMALGMAKKSFLTFVAAFIILLIIIFYDIVKYYKSGEFIYNYRKYKYPEYRKYIKAKKSKDLNTLNDLNNDGKEKPSEEVLSSGSKSEELSGVSANEIRPDEVKQDENN